MINAKAVIWDMDGVIIDTEGFWPQAERTVFTKVGVPEDEDFENATTGLRTLDVIDFWHTKYPWDKTHYPYPTLAKQIMDQMIAFVEKEGKALPFVPETFEFFHSLGLSQSIASSSPVVMINAVTHKLHISKYVNSVSSGEDEKFGKPAPDIYLTAAKKINFKPEECIVIEDSYNGALSAQRAGMHVFIIPHDSVFKNDEKLQLFKKIPNAKIIKDIRDIKKHLLLN